MTMVEVRLSRIELRKKVTKPTCNTISKLSKTKPLKKERLKLIYFKVERLNH